MSYFSEIKDMVEAMKPLLKKAGIDHEKRLYMHPLAEGAPDIILKPAHEWLTRVYGTVFKEAAKARRLIPEDQWALIEDDPEMEEAQEMLIWHHCKTMLAKTLSDSKRPDFFKKSTIIATLRRFYHGNQQKAANDIEVGGCDR